jgi:hypothetical protein
LLNHNRNVRGVYLEAAEGGSEALDANDGGAFGDFELRFRVRQGGYRQFGAFREPDVVTPSELNFGARSLCGVNLIACKQRQVFNGGRPFSHAGPKERDVSVNETQSRYSCNRRCVIYIVRLIVWGDGCLRECGARNK